MKQYISISQLQELAPEQQNKLRDWWQPQKYDRVAYTYKYYDNWETSEILVKGLYNGNPAKVEEVSDLDGEYVFMKDKCLPLMSIGIMIELLHDYKYDFINTHNLNWYGHDHSVFCSLEFIITTYPKYICDALWKAVKDIL